MELFSITCTTCKSRLRVREEGAIGQILACPKCGGMVMVKAPEGWVPGQPVPPPRVEPPAGATAVVEVKRKDETSSDSDFDAIDEILTNAPPKPKLPVVTVAPDAPGLARPRFAGNPAHSPAGGSAIGKAAAAGAPPSAAEHPPANSPKAEPTAQEAAAGSENFPDFKPPPAPRTWLTYLGLAASVVAGIGLAIAVVAATAGFFRGEPQQAVQVPALNPITSPGHQGQAREPAATTPDVEPAVPPTTLPPTPETPAPDTTQATPPASNTPPVPPTPVVAPVPPPRAASPFDALLEPDQDPLKPKTEEPVAKPAAPPPPDAAEDQQPAKPLVPRPEPRQVDVAARLADQIASLETEGTPLADFLQVLSDLSTIPITLEPDGLPLAQASATSPVVLKLSSTTIDGALTAGLRRLGLEHVPLEGQLFVRLIEPAEMPVMSYPHKDLTGGDEAAAADLAELIQAIVDPPSWTLGEAGASLEVSDTLRIKQRRANHAQIFLLCEKLRTARKLPYASKYPPALFQLDSRTRQATPRLRSPVSLNFHQPMPLVNLLREVEQAASPQNAGARGPSLRILVDWRDIAAGGWNPDAVTTLVVDGESLALALQKLLEPMELAWRVVDGQTIQVVSPVTLDSRCEIELFSVSDLLKDDATGQQLVANIRETLGEHLFRDQGGPCELRFDAASQCLVALLPQPKQQDLEVFLMTMRKPM